MADLSNSSFIPKRGPANKRKRAGGSKHVYVFTLVSYILMFSTLLATGGVYLYSNYVDQQLENEVSALNTEISSFSKADMQKVMDFDLRLSQAYTRLNNSVSLVSVFESLEAATIDSVQIISLNLDRENDEKFILSAVIETDSFDSTIFQRGVYGRNQTIDSVLISGIETSNVEKLGVDKNEDQGESTESVVSFTAELEVPLSAVPYVPTKAAETQPITIIEPADETVLESTIEVESVSEVETEVVDNNIENI